MEVVMAARPEKLPEQIERAGVFTFLKKSIVILAGSLVFSGILSAQSTTRSSTSDTRLRVRHITLEEAQRQAQQQAAQAAEKLMGRVGQLQIEAAKQHR